MNAPHLDFPSFLFAFEGCDWLSEKRFYYLWPATSSDEECEKDSTLIIIFSGPVPTSTT